MPAPHAEVGNNRLGEAKFGRTELSGEGGFGNERLSDKRFPLPGFVLVYSNSITAIGETSGRSTSNLSVESVDESEALSKSDIPDLVSTATLNSALVTGRSPLPRLVTGNISDVVSYSSEVYPTRNSSVVQSDESEARAVTNTVGSSPIVSLVRYPSVNGVVSIPISNIHGGSAGESIGTGLSDVPLSTSFVGINESTGVGDSPIPRITTDSRVDVSTSPVFVGLSEADVITHIYEAEATSFASILRSSFAGVSFTEDVYADAIGFVAETDLRIESVNESTATASPDIPQIDTIGKIDDSAAKSDSPLPRLETQNPAQSGEFTGSGSIANNLSIIRLNESESTGEVKIPIVSTRAPSDAEAVIDSAGFISRSEAIVSLDESTGEATAGLANTFAIGISTPPASVADVDGSVGTTSFDALLGGTVTDPDANVVEGAEVHILRDNDDTKVASTTTDSNGKWSAVLPGQEYNDTDPPVYSIEVWYRDGDKRDPKATLYNAKNRPYIDTSDPSQSSPYK